MNKKVLWITIAVLVWILLSFILPMQFWAKVASVLSIPFVFLFNLSFYILHIAIFMLFGLFLYTLATRNYQQLNKHYFVLCSVVVFCIASVRFDILFHSTSFFKVLEFIILYFIIMLLLVSIALLVWIAQKNDVRYYSIIFVLILIYLVLEFIGFYGI